VHYGHKTTHYTGVYKVYTNYTRAHTRIHIVHINYTMAYACTSQAKAYTSTSNGGTHHHTKACTDNEDVKHNYTEANV